MRSPPREAAANRETDLERRFAALVSEHGDRCVGLAWRLVGGDSAAAEDVAQEALLRASQALGRFRDGAKRSTWLYRIVVREAARHRRWRAVRQRLGGLGATWMAGPGDATPAPTTLAAPAVSELGEALLALADSDELESDAGFPEEYLAIEELLIEGGV